MVLFCRRFPLNGIAVVQRTNGEIALSLREYTELDIMYYNNNKNIRDMEETIKNIEVIAYKGMKSDMTCKGFHYELGETYKTDKAKINECGFHACLNPIDVLDYYSKGTKSRYFKVKLSGEIANCDKYDTKIAATEITILEEISNCFDEVIETTEWWKNDNVIDLLYFSDGLAIVRIGNDEYNFIDKEGKILSDEWFRWVDDFNDGLAIVRRGNGEYNLIDKKGKILYNEWFVWVSYFQDGLAIVQRGYEKYNYIDKKGNILSDEWFMWVDNFNDGLAIVRRGNGELCKIDKTGKIVSE